MTAPCCRGDHNPQLHPRTGRPGRTFWGALALLLPGILSGGNAWADGTPTQICLYNHLRAWVEDSTRAAAYLELFDLQATSGPWLIGARLEVDEETRTDPERSLGIQRRFAEYRGTEFTLRGGTFYATFGRGLLLRAEEDDAVRLDRDIDGVLGSMRWRACDGQAFLGRPRNDITHERDDVLAGGELGVRLFPKLHIGAGYVRRDASSPAGSSSVTADPNLGRPVEELVGGNMQWSHGVIDAAFEGAKRYVWGRWDPLTGWTGTSGKDGHALYGAITVGVPGYTFLVEGKDYQRFDAPYSTLPPANSAGQPINGGRDELGAGLSLTASPQEDLTLESAGSYAEARDEPGRRSAAELSLRKDWWGRGALEAGGEWTEEIELESHQYRQFYGPSLEASYYFTPETSLSLHSKVQSWTNQRRAGRRDEYTEVSADLSLATSGSRAATLSIIRASHPVEEYENDDTWVSLELAWGLGIGHDLKIKFGEERGGVTCSGGVCHYEPPFSGVRIELLSRF